MEAALPQSSLNQCLGVIHKLIANVQPCRIPKRLKELHCNFFFVFNSIYFFIVIFFLFFFFLGGGEQQNEKKTNPCKQTQEFGN